MKKTISLLIAFALMFTATSVCFAANTYVPDSYNLTISRVIGEWDSEEEEFVISNANGSTDLSDLSVGDEFYIGLFADDYQSYMSTLYGLTFEITYDKEKVAAATEGDFINNCGLHRSKSKIIDEFTASGDTETGYSFAWTYANGYTTSYMDPESDWIAILKMKKLSDEGTVDIAIKRAEFSELVSGNDYKVYNPTKTEALTLTLGESTTSEPEVDPYKVKVIDREAVTSTAADTDYQIGTGVGMTVNSGSTVFGKMKWVIATEDGRKYSATISLPNSYGEIKVAATFINGTHGTKFAEAPQEKSYTIVEDDIDAIFGVVDAEGNVTDTYYTNPDADRISE